jgi:hypothetical protein
LQNWGSQSWFYRRFDYQIQNAFEALPEIMPEFVSALKRHIVSISFPQKAGRSPQNDRPVFCFYLTYRARA